MFFNVNNATNCNRVKICVNYNVLNRCSNKNCIIKKSDGIKKICQHQHLYSL